MPTAAHRKAPEARSQLLLSMPLSLRETFERAAQRDHRTLSDFIRVGALERANRVLGIDEEAAEAAA